MGTRRRSFKGKGLINMGLLMTADFETTTDPNDCRVWAWGVCDIYNPEFFEYGNSIESFMDYVDNKKYWGSTFYFHNARFDSEFIFSYLFEHGYKYVEDSKELASKTFTSLISDMGQFYSCKIVFEKKGKRTKYIEIYDSLKVLPFSVEQVAKGFALPISKLEIDYDAYRPIGHKLTGEEIAYLRNDVEIMARALRVLFDQNLTKMTQGSNALHDFKEMLGKRDFNDYFPPPDYDHDVRQSYKGGFTYLQPEYKSLDLGEGLVFDVNSLYPSVMNDCPLPYGEGIYFEGQYVQDELYPLYVQMLTCQFEIKSDHIPTIQIKHSLAFIPNEYITSSGYEDVTLCLTSVDLELFFAHYEVYNPQYHSGWKFKASTKIFRPYIKKWMKVKIDADKSGNSSMRTLAKLMLNSLYGKLATSPKVQGKHPFYDNGVIRYYMGDEESRQPLYIPAGAFITAWARYKTITSAQQVKKYFVYADTDSLHLVMPLPDAIRGMSNAELKKLTTKDLKKLGIPLPDGFEVDPFKLGAWKLESRFTRARFIRQKSYVEDWNPPETWGTPEYDRDLFNITCAGMPKGCYDFVTWDNFKEGSTFKGKLIPHHVKGGIVLTPTEFTINWG